MTNVTEYVSEVLEISQEPNEDRNTFLQRVAFEIQSLDEEAWNKMPVELQEWYNKAADTLADAPSDEDIELDDLPVAEPKKGKKLASKKVKEAIVEATPEVEKAEDDAAESDEAKEPKKRGRKPSGEPKKEKAPKEPRGPIAANAVREILCEDMTTTLDELMTKLEERGVNMQRSSAQVVHLNTVRAFEVALEVGKVCKKGEVVLTTEV